MYYIYFIRSGDIGRPIKIGITNNIKNRIMTMQTGSPDLLHLIGVIPADSRFQAQSVESWFHKRYKKHRIRGEWFSGSIKLRKGINKIELDKYNIKWSKVRDFNDGAFWKLENYGYDISKIKKGTLKFN